jgi:aminopeptidase YwaD
VRALLSSFIALLMSATGLHAAGLGLVEVARADRAMLTRLNVPVYCDLGASVLVGLDESTARVLAVHGWPVEVLDEPLAAGSYYLVAKAGPGRNALPAAPLWQDDRRALVRLGWNDAVAAKAAGFEMVRLPSRPHDLPPLESPALTLPTAADTAVGRLVELVAQESLTRTIRDLEAFGTRYSYRSKCESAACYLHQRLADIGYAVRMDTYYLPSPRTRSFNVEATLDGLVSPESIIIACAHYDSYSSDFDRAPGANDDGTGTAAVIELARLMRDAGFRWTVKFLCFSGEEQWMLGSGHWVDSTAVPQQLKIAGVYNLDMFGFTAHDTKMLYVTRNAASLPLAVLAESTNAWYTIGLRVVNFLDEDCAGDNTPFWENGYKAVFACEDSEWGIWNGSDPYYHTPGDTFGNLRMGQVSRTTRLAAACIATLAGPYTTVPVEEPATGRQPHRPGTVAGALFAPTDGRLVVRDISGRVVATSDNSHPPSGLPVGVYFIGTSGSASPLKTIRVR